MANIHRLGDLGDNNNPQSRNMRFGNNGSFPLNFNSAPDSEAQGINIPFMNMQPQGQADPRKETFWDMLKINMCPSLKCLSVSVGLILINCFVFFLLECPRGIQAGGTLLEIGYPNLISLGANNVASVKIDKQYWRLLFSLFLHGNLMHLLVSSVMILVIVTAIEKTYGLLNTSLLYILSGVGGNLFAVSTLSASLDIYIGTSIPITGLFASVLSYFLLNWVALERIGPLREYLLCIFIMVFFLCALLPGGSSSQLSTIGSLGGFISGFLLGVVLPSPIAKSNHTYYVKLFCSIILGVFCVLGVIMVLADK